MAAVFSDGLPRVLTYLVTVFDILIILECKGGLPSRSSGGIDLVSKRGICFFLLSVFLLQLGVR